MIRKLKKRVHYLLLNIIDFIASHKAVIRDPSIAVVRIDAIGDYILFRNFLRDLKLSSRYQGYAITLIGNDAWQEIAQTLDSEFVDSFIFINRHKFYRNYYYRFKMIQKISAYGFSVVINPMYSRDHFLSESIVKVITAKEKITHKGSTDSFSKMQCTDNIYSALLPNKDEIMFEFYRNKEFFEQLLDKKLSTALLIEKNKLPVIKQALPDRFIVLFLGASRPFRQWSAKNFAELANYLKEKHGYDIVICGSIFEEKQAALFKSYFQYDYIDLVGKTSLIELMSVITACQMLISNETSAAHCAVALETNKIFVLYNGVHFGRFAPYPQALHQNYYLICHPEISKDKEHYQQITNSGLPIKKLNINDITVDQVVHVLEEAI